MVQGRSNDAKQQLLIIVKGEILKELKGTVPMRLDRRETVKGSEATKCSHNVNARAAV